MPGRSLKIAELTRFWARDELSGSYQYGKHNFRIADNPPATVVASHQALVDIEYVENVSEMALHSHHVLALRTSAR